MRKIVNNTKEWNLLGGRSAKDDIHVAAWLLSNANVPCIQVWGHAHLGVLLTRDEAVSFANRVLKMAEVLPGSE